MFIYIGLGNIFGSSLSDGATATKGPQNKMKGKFNKFYFHIFKIWLFLDDGIHHHIFAK